MYREGIFCGNAFRCGQARGFKNKCEHPTNNKRTSSFLGSAFTNIDYCEGGRTAICEDLRPPGFPLLICVQGYGGPEGKDINGAYDLCDGEPPSWKKRGGSAEVSFSNSVCCWVLHVDVKGLLRSGFGGPTPIGPWEGGFTVVACYHTNSVVSKLAFPAPEMEYSWYETYQYADLYEEESGDEDYLIEGIGLLKRPDLVFLHTAAGERIPAVHVKQPGAQWTIIYSHGNAEDLGEILDYVDELSYQTTANVLAYDYVGYSLSRLEGGAPSEAGCNRSITAAWIYLTEDLAVASSSVVFFGRSIGCGPTIDLASRFEGAMCAGVILEAPLRSGAHVLIGNAGALVQHFDIFLNSDKIGSVKRPVAIMHGTADEMVPVSNGQYLYEHLSHPTIDPLWLEGYGHDDMPHETCFAYVSKFLYSLGHEFLFTGSGEELEEPVRDSQPCMIM